MFTDYVSPTEQEQVFAGSTITDKVISIGVVVHANLHNIKIKLYKLTRPHSKIWVGWGVRPIYPRIDVLAGEIWSELQYRGKLHAVFG
jgi:hypothetical protein